MYGTLPYEQHFTWPPDITYGKEGCRTVHIILVKVPYNLRLSDEVRIYEKLLGESGLKGVHIAPHTLKVASMFAILTRLEPSKKAGLSLMKKLKLYDGDAVCTLR